MAQYILSQAAERDFAQIMRTSLRDFGRLASIRYKELISEAIRQVAQNPERHGSRAFEKGVPVCDCGFARPEPRQERLSMRFNALDVRTP